MKETEKHQPKFNVGDKVRHVWGNKVQPVTEVTDKGYQIKGEGFVSFDYEEFWELVEQPRFKVGDIIRIKGGKERLKITNICDDVYWASPEGLNNKHLFDIRFTEEDEFKLVNEPEPKLKLGVDLNDKLRIDTLWKDTLANLVDDITKRNTDSFVWLIDETLKFMDCDAYVDDVREGMRLFTKELKKRIGYETDIY